MYNHAKQYRCTIIRGKSQKEVDDLLPAYAKVIDEICPCEIKSFQTLFDRSFIRFLPNGTQQKTLDNHRTEIAGSLFGMYYFANDGKAYASERTLKFLADNDTPAFFKDLCFKMQFPNGTQKIQTVQERIENKINLRPNAFLLKLLQLANGYKIALTKKEIGYYILNSLDVLQGNASPLEVLDTIANDRKNGILREVKTPEKASSFDMQHINEQINLLELANLLIEEQGYIRLNPREDKVISLIAEGYNQRPLFDVYSYNLTSKDGKNQFYGDWDYYFAKLSDKADEFATEISALIDISQPITPKAKTGINLVEFGDEGEQYVFEYEKKRVEAFNFRLTNKVIHLGKTKGLGYDIQSVVAEQGDFAEFVKYIEVKSTKRITLPDINDPLWVDTLNITRNEWVAAQQHKDFYHIYRVYFVRDRIVMFVISNIAQKQKDKVVEVIPITFRVDFRNNAVNQVIVGGQNV